MEISKGIEIIGLSLWIKEKSILIISDLHLGYEDYLRSKGILVPKFQIKETFLELKKILNKVNPEIIILNGDLKHEFGRISSQEWKDILALFDLLISNSKKVVVLKGNHDTILGPIAEKKKVEILPSYSFESTLIVHGDSLIETNSKRIIIGHEHPAVSLKDQSKTEKFKCFLKGKWKRRELIVMPSFNPLIEGTDILKERLLSPFLNKLNDFKAFVVNKEEVFDFGKVKKLR